MQTSILRACGALLLLAVPATAGAQVFSSHEIERGLAPGVRVPHDGQTPAQRYAYRTEALLYFNGSARQLWYLDYLDRMDRAERFGYRRPADPFFPPRPAYHVYPAAPCDCPPPVYRYSR